MVEKLADTLRNQVEEVRQLERAVLHTCVDRAGMPRTHFIKAVSYTHLVEVPAE